VAGTGAKQEDEALFRRIQDLMQTKPFTYLSQTSGATVAAAVAGHQGGVVASVNNPSEGLQPLPGEEASTALCVHAGQPDRGGVLVPSDLQVAGDRDRRLLSSCARSWRLPGLSQGQQAFWVERLQEGLRLGRVEEVHERSTGFSRTSSRASISDCSSSSTSSSIKEIATKFKWV